MKPTIQQHGHTSIRITLLQAGVVVITFDNFVKQTVDQWATIIKSSDGRLPPAHRVLYDFRRAGPPSPYALMKVGPVMKDIDVPPDTRTAHLYRHADDMRFTDMILRMMPVDVGEVRPFDNFEAALRWLLR